MRLAILLALIGISLCLTMAMQLTGGKFSMTILLADTTIIEPYWLLPVEVGLAVAALARQGWTIGITIAGVLILGEELYLAGATQAVTDLSLRYQAAHVGIFVAIGLAGMAAYRELHP